MSLGQNLPVHLALDLASVNIVLEGLGKLEYARVEKLYTGIRGAALEQMRKAEEIAAAAAVVVAEPAAPATKIRRRRGGR